MECLGEFVQTVIVVGIGTIFVWLLLDDDRPNRVVDSKTLDIDGRHVTVETLADGTSRTRSRPE